jgi:hypothetical protein
MPNAGAGLSRFLVEWYSPRLSRRAIADIAQLLNDAVAAEPELRVQLLYLVAVPADDYVFSVFAASSADLVARACRRAGWPADRISPAVEHLPID